jgi:serine/threonine protein kinase
MFRPGDTVGSYTIMRKLGAGGMGEVYLAEHMHIARKAAIKVLLPELSSRQELVARLFNEARATARIRHPGIVEVLDCGVHPNGQAFIVMELLEGDSLSGWLRQRGKLAAEPEVAASLIGQIASALGAAHDQEIIHRDLKPDNVFVVSNGPPPVIKVLDFGVAKVASDGRLGGHETAGGALLGTPIYMAPEQCRGTGRLDRRSDIYALGCVAFEILTARPPFVCAGAGEFIVAHLTESPPPVRSIDPRVPEPLAALVARMLAKDPNERPQNMGEVIRALMPLVSNSQASFAGWTRQATPGPVTVVLPAVPTPAPPAPAPSPPQTTFGQSASEVRLPTLRTGGNPALKRVIISAGVVVAGFLTWALLFSSSDRPHQRGPAPLARDLDPPLIVQGAPDVASAPAPAPRRLVPVELVTNPPGAEVWIADDPARLGHTPLPIETGDIPVLVRLRSPGYVERSLSLTAADAPRVTVTLERAATKKVHKPVTPARPKGYIKLED